MELEWLGIPSVAIVHEGVEQGVRAMARISGMHNYGYAVVRYPHALHPGWDDDELTAIVNEITPIVLELLTTPLHTITSTGTDP
jgi:hypothetical protein